MSAALWRCRCRGIVVVLASGAAVSLSALTGGIAPALADPPNAPVPSPVVPVPRPPAPLPAPPPPPAPRPVPQPPPAPRAAPRVVPQAPAPHVEPQAPAPHVEPQAPAPHVEPQAPVHNGAPAPAQSAPQAPVHNAAPGAPNSEAGPPVTNTVPVAPHEGAAPPNQPAPNGPNPQVPNKPEPNQAPGGVRPFVGPTPGSRPGSAPGNGTGPGNPAPHGASPGSQAVTVHEATKLQAPQQDVVTAEASVPFEHKPDPVPATDVDSFRDRVLPPGTDDNWRNRGGQNWGAPGPDRPDFDGHQWDHQVRQWDRNWIRYDDYYRPIICNPYQDQLQILYDYEGAPQIVVIPPLGSAVLDAADDGAYDFTAVLLDAVGEAADVAVGSFFGGGYDPGDGLLPPPPPPLQSYDDVPVAVDYPGESYDPFLVSQLVDVGPDPQYGEDKALLDGSTPVWGDWTQTPDGQREFDVHKTQQFPGLDTPASGPLPGNYQLHLASKASPGMPARDVFIVASSAVVATLALCGAAAFAVARRRRRRTWYYPLPLPH